MVIKSYRDLIVWQKSMDVVTTVYRITGDFPREEIYGLTSQIRRSAVSIPSNIAEGYGRNSTQDYIRFLQIANGSLFELQTQLEIPVNLSYLKADSYEAIMQITSEIERMLVTLIKKISKKN
ncbi:four helix bundle protein [Candidatus Latescibacterota bacterium]